MVYRVGINGFGRIGRQAFKAIQQGGFDDLFEVVAVNDLTSPETLATLLKYDSTYGRFDADISHSSKNLKVNGKEISVSAEKEPKKIPWKARKVDVVIESTGLFTKAEDAEGHIDAGAEKVIISAPAKGEDVTIVLGVNEAAYDPNEHDVISNASCTTNCLAPVAKVLLDNFGIRRGMMTTIHSYTNDQVVLDGPHKDPRRARSAAQNIIPTSTGAAKAVALVIPELKGKLTGIAMRVPVPTGSVVDLTVNLGKAADAAAINGAVRKAAEGPMKGILYYTEDPIVSSDIIGDPHSSIFAGPFTQVLGDNGKLAKVISWYDNEWGYSCRTADLIAKVGAL